MPLTYPLLARIHAHATANPDKTAIIDAQTGTAYSYAQLRGDVVALAGRLGRMAAAGGEGEGDLKEMRVGVLANKGYGVVVALLAVWVSAAEQDRGAHAKNRRAIIRQQADCVSPSCPPIPGRNRCTCCKTPARG